MTDRVFCRRHDPDGHANWDSGFRPLLDDTCYMCAAEQLEQQLQQAHKCGWEQCKFEAMTKSTGRSYDAIATMEYKEPTK